MAHPYKAKIMRALGGKVTKRADGGDVEKAKRYMGARMNISSSVVPDETYRLEREYDRARKAVGLEDRKRGGRK